MCQHQLARSQQTHLLNNQGERHTECTQIYPEKYATHCRYLFVCEECRQNLCVEKLLPFYWEARKKTEDEKETEAESRRVCLLNFKH